jgi:hypothetical protein
MQQRKLTTQLSRLKQYISSANILLSVKMSLRTRKSSLSKKLKSKTLMNHFQAQEQTNKNLKEQLLDLRNLQALVIHSLKRLKKNQKIKMPMQLRMMLLQALSS